MNPYPKNSLIYNLFEQIKSTEELKYLLISKKSDLSYSKQRLFYIQQCETQCNSKGLTHLHKCIMRTNAYPFLNEYIDEFLKLCSNGIETKNDKGCTALMLASLFSNSRSSIKTVKILLKHKANINSQDNFGCTTLMNCILNSKTNYS